MRRRLGPLLLFLLLSVATRAPFLSIPVLNVDESAHLTGSWELMRGGRLYTDFVDHKPPLIYAYYALAQALMGRGLLAVRLLTLLVALPLTALGLSSVLAHGRRGAWAGGLFLVYGASYLAYDMQAVNGEVVMLLPAVWALAAVRDPDRAARLPWLACSGALVAVAALVKPQAALWLPAVAFAAWRAAPERRAARLAALAAGTAVPLALTVALFAAQGNLGDFLYWNLAHNLRYAANPTEAGEVLTRAARTLLPFLLVTAPLWWAGLRGARLLDAHVARLAAAALAGSAAAAFLGLRFFPHYFIQLHPPLALLAAPVFAAWTRPRPRAALAALGWTGAMVAGFTGASLWLYRRTDVYDETRPVFGSVAARLAADPCRGDARLFVWGFAPGFYVSTGLRPASRFVVPPTTLSGFVPGNRSLDAAAAGRLVREDHWRLLIGDLERTRATYVLDTAGAGLHHWRGYPAWRFPPLWDLLQRAYEPLADVDGVRIYRRRGCADRPSLPVLTTAGGAPILAGDRDLSLGRRGGPHP